MNLPSIHGYVYWLLLSDESSQVVEEWIEKLKKKIPIPPFAPHLTLSRIPDEPGEYELPAIAGSIASKYPAIHLEADGLDGKQHPYRSLYIKISPSVRLLSLRSELISLLRTEKEPGYNPHISLVYGSLKENEREKLKEEINLRPGTRFLADRLALVKLEGTPRQWSIIHTQKLSGISD